MTDYETPLIHLICGSTGAGKTTYARELATNIGGVVFSIDEWMVTLFGEDALVSRLQNSGAKAVVTDKGGAAKLSAFRDQLPELREIIVPEEEPIEVQSDALDIAETTPETPGCLIGRK